jgi:hypothetical protein
MKRDYRLLILSFLLLNVFGWVVVVEIKYGIPRVIKYALSSLVIAILTYYRFIKPAKNTQKGLLYPDTIVFLLYSLFLLTTSLLEFNTFYLQMALGSFFFFFPYLLPILVLFTKFDLDFFKDFFYYSFVLLIPTIIVQLYIILISISQLNWVEQVTAVGIFDIGGLFLILTVHFLKKKYASTLVMIYFLLMIFMWSYYGRRGMLVESALILFFMLLIRLKSSILKFADRIKIYFSIVLTIMLFITFGYVFLSSYAFQRGFNRDAFEESRGIVFDDFFFDFNTTREWIFGRGLDGTVYRSINFETEMSDTIENGFLAVILKGGLLYLVPFIIVLLRASYLGFFKSNNDLVKALASLIIIYILMMSYFNLPSFTTRYIFLWIAASACFSPSIRRYSNDEVCNAINSKFGK